MRVGEGVRTPATQRVHGHRSVSVHAAATGVLSLGSSGVGMAALLLLVKSRTSLVDMLTPALSKAVLVVAVAGLVMGGLSGILALGRSEALGVKASGLGVAGLLIAVWFTALGLEVAAMLRSSPSSASLSRPNALSPGAAGMAVAVLVAATVVTGVALRRVAVSRRRTSPRAPKGATPLSLTHGEVRHE